MIDWLERFVFCITETSVSTADLSAASIWPRWRSSLRSATSRSIRRKLHSARRISAWNRHFSGSPAVVLRRPCAAAPATPAHAPLHLEQRAEVDRRLRRRAVLRAPRAPAGPPAAARPPCQVEVDDPRRRRRVLALGRPPRGHRCRSGLAGPRPFEPNRTERWAGGEACADGCRRVGWWVRSSFFLGVRRQRSGAFGAAGPWKVLVGGGRRREEKGRVQDKRSTAQGRRGRRCSSFSVKSHDLKGSSRRK